MRTGPLANPTYSLKPTIRLVVVANTGSISGTVTNPVNVPVALAMSGADTVTVVFVDTMSGEFQLAFLEEGSYDVVVEDSAGARFDSTAVEVTLEKIMISAESNCNNHRTRKMVLLK